MPSSTWTVPESFSRVTSKPAPRKTPSIARFSAEHLGDEAADAAVAAGGGEVLQQEAAEPVPVLLLVDQERDLGHVGRHRLGRAQRHDPVADGHDEAGDRGVGGSKRCST